MAEGTSTEQSPAPQSASKSASKVVQNGISVEEFLSNSRTVKETSRYAQAAFKTWIKLKVSNLVGARQSESEWAKLFAQYLAAPAK